MFKKLEDFQGSLNRLHFEGKSSYGKNIQDVCQSVDFFSRDLCAHMSKEESVLFPFLETHVPKLGPVISLLLAEHHDFRQALGQLQVLLSSVQKRGAPQINDIESVVRVGNYLVYLLRSHLWAESETIDKTMREVLRPDERKKLLGRMNARPHASLDRKHSHAA